MLPSTWKLLSLIEVLKHTKRPQLNVLIYFWYISQEIKKKNDFPTSTFLNFLSVFSTKTTTLLIKSFILHQVLLRWSSQGFPQSFTSEQKRGEREGRKEGERERGGNYCIAAHESNCSETKDQGMKGPSATYRQRERRAGCRARCDLKTRSQTQQKIRLS